MIKHSEKGLALLKRFEGCRLVAYRDGAGIWSIGFGSTENVYDGMRITMDEALRRLQDHLMPLEVSLEHAIHVPLTQNQQDAIISCAYNLGCRRFQNSNILSAINRGDMQAAAGHFGEYIHDHSGAVELGLVKRREAERALFLGG